MVMKCIINIYLLSSVCVCLRQLSTTNKYTTLQQQCTLSLLKDRRVLTTFESGDLDCVRNCVATPDCEMALVQKGENMSPDCTLMSYLQADVQSQSFYLSSAGECSAYLINMCRNGGILSEGVCKCTKDFAGQFCEYSNPSSCAVKWRKIKQVFSNFTTVFVEPLVLTDTARHQVKVRYRDEANGMAVIWSESYHREDIDLLTVSRSFMEKSSWNSYEPSPKRLFQCALDSADNETIKTLFTIGQSCHLNSTHMAYEILATTEEIYTYQNESNWLRVKAEVEAGHEFSDTAAFIAILEDPVVIFQSVFRKLSFQRRAITEPPRWKAIKTILGDLSSIMRVNIGTGITGQPGTGPEKPLYFNPCWVSTVTSGNNTLVSSTALGVFLTRGHNVRVRWDARYHNVVEVIQAGGEFNFVVEPYLDSYDALPFNANAAHGVKTLISSAGRAISCLHVVETDTVVGHVTSTGTDVGWFVDTKIWTKVYAVFSNASVAHGSLSDLASGVKEGRDVRLWLQWLDSDRSRYMSTQWNAVADDGKVSTESVLTWNTQRTSESNVTLSPQCDYQQVLVSSDGRVEVVTFNILTPGTVEILTDHFITWFLH